MDASQVTGASSSYARKYALNGLFAIDDTKDADTLNTSPQYTQPEQSAKTPAPQPARQPAAMPPASLASPAPALAADISACRSQQDLKNLQAKLIQSGLWHDSYRTIFNQTAKQNKWI